MSKAKKVIKKKVTEHEVHINDHSEVEVILRKTDLDSGNNSHITISLNIKEIVEQYLEYTVRVDMDGSDGFSVINMFLTDVNSKQITDR